VRGTGWAFSSTYGQAGGYADTGRGLCRLTCAIYAEYSLERATRIELAFSAWEAVTRKASSSVKALINRYFGVE